MHKVVVERPRHGRSWVKSKAPPRPPFDDALRYESMKARHTQRKWFSDLLGPLKRWLQSQVGRPWNDVYSQACAVIKPDSVIRAHIKTHLLEFVERNTFMHDGKVCVLDTRHRSRGVIPVTELRYGRSRFFVHPESGLLFAIPQKSWKALRAERRASRSETLRWLDCNVALKQIYGIWFACQFCVVSDEGPFKAYDHALAQHVGRGGLLRRNGQYRHCVSKRQLSSRELKRYGLRNVAQVKAQSSVGRQQDQLTTALQLSAGRRLWVLVDPAISVQIRSVACGGGATFSTPGNSTIAFLPASISMGRRHRVIGHWF